MIRIITLFLLFTTIAGCSLFEPRIIYVPTVQPVICSDYVKPDPITTLPVQFVLAKDDLNQYVLGLDGVNYSNLAINTSRSLSYIRQQKAVINYLDGCIKAHNEKGEQ